jgi:hypothetical protein
MIRHLGGVLMAIADEEASELSGQSNCNILDTQRQAQSASRTRSSEAKGSHTGEDQLNP